MLRVIFWACSLALGCAAAHSFGQQETAAWASASATNPVVELKGELVRLSEKAGEPVGFKTERGTVYTLVSNHMSSALFIDTNLLGKTLILKGRESKAKCFEVTGNLRSFRSGKIHKLYYSCEICAIEGIDPGPCMCCRDPVHLVEEPPN